MPLARMQSGGPGGHPSGQASLGRGGLLEELMVSITHGGREQSNRANGGWHGICTIGGSSLKMRCRKKARKVKDRFCPRQSWHRKCIRIDSSLRKWSTKRFALECEA